MQPTVQPAQASPPQPTPPPFQPTPPPFQASPPSFDVSVPPPPVPTAPYWEPPVGPGGGKSRTGLIVGITAAAIVVLAGIGVGVYFGFLRDGGGSVETTTTAVASSTTEVPVTVSTEPVTVTTGAETTTTVGGAATTQTIPSLNSTTTGPPATDDLITAYLTATDDLVAELDYDDTRIPQLATKINSTAPKVPEAVRDELSTMLGSLDALNVELASLDVPPPFEESYDYLEEAVMHMGSRIDATIQGIEEIWNAGKISKGANQFFEQGRQDRDAYRAAMEKYYNALPVE